MPLFENNFVRIVGGVVLWDGISRPETSDDGKLKWNVKIAVPPNCPDLALLDQLTRQELASCPFKGTMPNGGKWPMNRIEPNDYDGNFVGYFAINCSTFRQPVVLNEQNQPMDVMQYGQMLYPGQRVDVLVHAKYYDNKSKGIAARLDGLQIIASANAPRANIGGAGVNAQAAFGAMPAQQLPQSNNGGYQQPQNQGGYQQQPQNQGFQGNTQTHADANNYGSNQYQGGNNQGNFNQQPQQNYVQQPQNQGGGYQPQNTGGYQQQPQNQGGGGSQYPNQNSNFMPNY
jgi:hypothetical protein